MLLLFGKLFAIAGMFAVLLSSTVLAEPELVETRESQYNSIFVHRYGPYLSLSFGLNDRLYVESKANSEDPLELASVYTRYMVTPMVYQDRTASLLEIGLGGGTTTTYLNKTFPDLKIHAVEIDPVVTEMAEKYFFAKPGPNLNITSRDGRMFLMRPEDSYDVILVDAYRGPYIPFHLMTQEFFQLAKQRLNPGGVFAYNVYSGTKLYDAALATIGTVFDNVDIYSADKNYVIVAYDGPKQSDETLRQRAAAIDRDFGPRYPLSRLVADRKPAKDFDGQVLTDDFAPVDYLHATERPADTNG